MSNSGHGWWRTVIDLGLPQDEKWANLLNLETEIHPAENAPVI